MDESASSIHVVHWPVWQFVVLPMARTSGHLPRLFYTYVAIIQIVFQIALIAQAVFGLGWLVLLRGYRRHFVQCAFEAELNAERRAQAAD